MKDRAAERLMRRQEQEELEAGLREFSAVEAEAHSRLRRPRRDDSVLPGGQRAALLFEPAHDNRMSWVINESSRGSELGFFAARCVWDRKLDLAAFNSAEERARHPTPFEPTLRFERIQVDSGALGDALHAIERCQIMVRPENLGGCIDGDCWDISVGTHSASTWLRWHSYKPEGWPELRALVARLLAVLEPAGLDRYYRWDEHRWPPHPIKPTSDPTS